MKKSLVFLAEVLAGCVTALGQVTITSFNQNGQLTWTNSVTNATYRVEWAGSASGPWRSFDGLTNLTLLSVASNSVTVQVPTFYRVVWVDPPRPEPDGTWDFKAFDRQDVLVVTGRLFLVSQTNPPIGGTRNLSWTGNATTAWNFMVQVGIGPVGGDLHGNDLFLDLNLGWFDDNYYLRGSMLGGYAAGSWNYSSFVGESVEGRFVAVKQSTPALARNRGSPVAKVNSQPSH